MDPYKYRLITSHNKFSTYVYYLCSVPVFLGLPWNSNISTVPPMTRKECMAGAIVSNGHRRPVPNPICGSRSGARHWPQRIISQQEGYTNIEWGNCMIKNWRIIVGAAFYNDTVADNPVCYSTSNILMEVVLECLVIMKMAICSSWWFIKTNIIGISINMVCSWCSMTIWP